MQVRPNHIFRRACPRVVKVHLRTPLRPTEVDARVVAAALRFFPDGEVDIIDGEVWLQSNDLTELRNRIWELRIIDTFRGQYLHGVSNDLASSKFRLSKQAASQGKLSFPPTPHGLGDLVIRVFVEDGDPWADAVELAWWLCPETKDGEIVGLTD